MLFALVLQGYLVYLSGLLRVVNRDNSLRVRWLRGGSWTQWVTWM